MYTRTASAFLLFLTLSQAHSLDNVQPVDDFSSAELLLQILNDTVLHAIQQSLPVLVLLPNELQAAAVAVIIPVRVEIQKIYDRLVMRVDSIKLRAEAEGKNISQCLSTYQYELNLLPQSITGEITACVNVTVQAGTEIVHKSIQDIRNRENDVLFLSFQLEQCRIFGEPSCIQPVRESIEVQLIELPARINEDTDITMKAVKAMEAELPPCSADKIVVMSTGGSIIVDYIQDCVDNIQP